MATQAGQNDNCKCPICDRVCSSPYSREDHLSRTLCGLTCRLCRKVFPTPNDLKDHGKAAHLRCYCFYCDKICVSRHARIYHEQYTHFYCKPCESIFPNQEKWDEHNRNIFHYISCPKCNRNVREFNGEWQRHVDNCSGSSRNRDETSSKRRSENINFKYGKGDPKHQTPKQDHAKSNKKREPNEVGLPDGIPDFYRYLKIHPSSTQEEIAQAARKRRIEFHPDKLKKPGMTNKELEKIDQAAMQVGWAADVLLDPEKKANYDMKLAAYHFSKRRH